MKNWRKYYDGRPRLFVDNFTANAGSGGDTFAADDIAGVKFPRSKIIIGADGTNDGDVSAANPLPVTGTVAVTNTGLTELAAAINSSQLDVNIAASAATITVASHAVTNAGTFATQVDGAALTALQLIDDVVYADDVAFTAATNKVIATGGIVTADSVDAGDVGAFAMLANRQQKVTLYDSAGAELAVGGGTQYTEDAAAAANPIGNALIVIREDGRAGSLTSTDGDNVALRGNNLGELYVKHTDSIAVTNAGLTELAAAINASSQMDVNIAASNATITVASHAVTNAGTFAVQVDGSALTALQLIDDAVYAEDVAAQAADKGIAVLAVRRDADTSLVGTDNDYANLQVDANGYLKVEIFDGGGSHTVDNAGTFAVQVDGSALTALQLIDNTIIVDDAAFTPATSSVNMAGFQADEASTDSVDEGDAGAARMTLDRKVIVNPQPHTGGGLTTARSLDLDETEEEIKATAGQVYGWNITNFATTTRHVKFYNATAANVTVGTTTPLFTLSIPGNTSDDTMLSMMSTHGIPFDTAITWAATTGLADNDTGAPAANDVAGTVWYK